jgi:hypothetical protein
LLVFVLGLAAVLPTRRAIAQSTTTGDAARAEARERFERGLRLFNAGDNAAALVEFRRAYELIENAVVLYNIGLVYAQMGRPVEATGALDKVLANPGALSAERLALARKTRDEQAMHVAEVVLDTNVERARVEVDGVEVATAPMAEPLRVTSGTHVIGIVAPGFVPLRKEIAIAGRDKQSLRFELEAMQGRLAHLVVTTHLPGADLVVDDQRVATTPLASSIALSPGPHRIQLQRAGYVPAKTEITLADGASGEVALAPEEDRAAVESSGGWLALVVSETLPVVTIDGRSRGVSTGPLRLVAGPHELLVERGDFIPWTRQVTIDPSRTTTVNVQLDPTPEYRTRFASRASTQRTWGIVSIVGGVVLAGAGAGLALYDAKQRSDGMATQAAIKALSVRGSMSICDRGGDTTTPAYAMNCSEPFAAASSKIDDANTRDIVAFAAVGVGAAATVLGVTLVVLGDNPHKYDSNAPRDVAARRIVPMFWKLPGGGLLGVAGVY